MEDFRHVWNCRNSVERPVVEGTHQGPMVCLPCCLAWMDARCLRFHDLSADHAADQPGIRCAADRGDCGIRGDVVVAPDWRYGRRLARGPMGPQDTADD